MEVILNYLKDYSNQRDKINHIKQLESEIKWLENEMTTKKLSQANIETYKHQIRYKEIYIALLSQ